MRAIDTNVIVRLIARDDPNHLSIVETLIDEPFLLLPTVILESVWVLESRFDFDRQAISAKMRQLLGHINAVAPDGDAVGWALDRYENGADFADMVHIALAATLDVLKFATFDRRVARHTDEPRITIEQLG